jgi:ubiquitin conjugation factor E4 B
MLYVLVSRDDANSIRFPLPDEIPAEYANLPEYFFEVIGDYYSYAGRVFPQLINHVDELVMFSIVFLRMSNYVKNPERKSRLVELLHYGLSPARGKPNGFLGDILLNQKFATDHLLNALMNFYIGQLFYNSNHLMNSFI